MSKRMLIELDVNGATCDAGAAGSDTLLTVLRDQLLLTGAKRGCNQGVCGACTVLVDGRAVRSCLSLAQDCEGQQIDTIEGLTAHSVMQALQNAFIAAGAFQCGFCTPGMLISAFALLTTNLRPTAQDIRDALSGNLCRCTGYKKIVEAVIAAAATLASEAAA